MSAGLQDAVKSLADDDDAKTAELMDDKPRRPESKSRRTTNSLGMAFREIPAGTMQMGTPSTNPFGDIAACEIPQHSVRISHPFWMGEHEVTVAQFRQFVDETGATTEAERAGTGVFGLDVATGQVEQRPEWIWSSPGFGQDETHPVVAVSWDDAQAFCHWLSEKDGNRYRLPTEAEWEYACRAGARTPFSSGELLTLRKVANIGDLALQSQYPKATGSAPWNDLYSFTAPVGSFEPNAFGLFDMHGNVGEWCQDWFAADYYSESPEQDPTGPARPQQWRVVRGGSWYNAPASCRSASRHDGVGTAPSTTNGFRVVMERR